MGSLNAGVPAAPETGRLVVVRDRHWVVADVYASSGPLAAPAAAAQHRVKLASVEDDGLGEDLEVIWEVEPGARVLDAATLPRPEAGRFDPPGRLDAFLDAVRWGAITSADHQALQAPFRSGISIEEYQLDPVVRALGMPRVNLLIADDVGLGKTIEAGLVIQELLLRHRARSVMIVCPSSLQIKWRQEMAEKFGLDFQIVDRERVRELRRTRGLGANPFNYYPRLIVSIDWLKRPEQMRRLRDLLPADSTAYPRRFDLLVIDEVHMCAPAAAGRYATDSQRTRCVRELAPHFEHRLFLSATPHNGYTESFTALLELLDPLRFARGVEPSASALGTSVVRRLKSELREALGESIPVEPARRCDPDVELGPLRFPIRCIQEVEVEYPEREREAHALLARYTAARRRGAQASGRRSAQTAADFVTLLLKKRLFSSPMAFARTLRVHRETLAAQALAGGAHRPDDAAAVQAAFDRLDEEVALEDELELATEEALSVAAAWGGALASEDEELLDRLSAWAEQAASRADAKAERLLEIVERACRPDGEWTDARILLFTEFRDTQRYLAELLVARGLAGKSGERLALIYGGMDDEDRERIRAEFQAHPSKSPIRVLLATDAASEGIDLQRHCHRLVHVDIPFSPTRLEQRNGRVDRHLQPSSRVFIHHFVGKGWQTAAPGSTEADLAFLARVARKVDQIRDDLGSVGPVLAEEVQRQLLTGGGSVEAALQARQPQTARMRTLNRIERDLRGQVQRLAAELNVSRTELGIHPESVRRVVEVGLELGRQAPLIPTAATFSDGRSADAFRVPPLTHSWRNAAADLPDPVTGEPRPVTFDHEVARGNDEVVLAHLGHPLVAKALRLLRAEIWSSTGSLSRISARVAAVDQLTVVAHARLVVTGGRGHRLHEEVVAAGGTVREGRFRRLDAQRDVAAALAGATSVAAGEAVQRRLVALWAELEAPLYRAIETRAQERADSLAGVLARQQEQGVDAIRSVLAELERTIRARLDALDRPGSAQLEIEGLSAAEHDQWTRDVEGLRQRLARIPHDTVREVEAVRGRYANPAPRFFPAAVTFLVPRAMAEGRIV